MLMYGDDYFPTMPNINSILTEAQKTVWGGIQKGTIGFGFNLGIDMSVDFDEESWDDVGPAAKPGNAAARTEELPGALRQKMTIRTLPPARGPNPIQAVPRLVRAAELRYLMLAFLWALSIGTGARTQQVTRFTEQQIDQMLFQQDRNCARGTKAAGHATGAVSSMTSTVFASLPRRRSISCI